MQNDVLVRVLEMLLEQIKVLNTVNSCQNVILNYIADRVGKTEFTGELNRCFTSTSDVANALAKIQTKLDFLKQGTTSY